MMFCVDIREKTTKNTVKTILETESHDEAYETVDKYDKEHESFASLLQEYPKEKYFVDVYNDDTR